MATFLVIDLEATCSDDGAISPTEMEIIEIGACWATADGEVLERFQSFVKPANRSTLTPFCVELTGIQQQQVDSAPGFLSASQALADFARRRRTPTSIWGSWGAYDRKQFERECARHGTSDPLGMEHLNLKRLFAKAQRIGKEVGMLKALQLAGLQLEGPHHRALSDAANIARLLPWSLGMRSIKTQA
jgi:inhibitor of KinA sporulation pathway (predicted exonuclease)